jgi:hypothetical protein
MTYGLLVREPRYFDLGVLFGRIERFEAHCRRRAPQAHSEPPRALDMVLLREGGEFERAWAKEIAALIAQKRSDNAETRMATGRARATTNRIAQRIETARATGLAGLKVKARVMLWRRNGEPFAITGEGWRGSHAAN